MKSPAALLLLLALTPACTSLNGQGHNHWSPGPQLGKSISLHVFGFDNEGGSSYRDFAWEQKKHVALTLRRHVLNSNPENPFQLNGVESSRRPYNSILPNPVSYLLPTPIDSLIGTFEPGGFEEFARGVGYPLGLSDRHPQSQPVPPSEFDLNRR